MLRETKLQESPKSKNPKTQSYNSYNDPMMSTTESSSSARASLLQKLNKNIQFILIFCSELAHLENTSDFFHSILSARCMQGIILHHLFCFTMLPGSFQHVSSSAVFLAIVHLRPFILMKSCHRVLVICNEETDDYLFQPLPHTKNI